MQTQYPSRAGLTENAGYFPVQGAHLYTVLHRVADPVARVLLAGPFASERHFGYHTSVRWARYLAAKGVEVLRYDYRGVGESTGVFEEMSFEHWSEDVRLLAEWLRSQLPSAPVVLHGIELGAILTGRIFQEGGGDALLLWSPPANANQALRSTLLRWVALEQLYESPESRKTVSDYIKQVERGSSIDVMGYQWSSELWRESSEFDMPSGLDSEDLSCDTRERPAKLFRFGKDSAALTLPYARYPEVRDLSELYASSLDWLTGAVAAKRSK